MTHYNHSLIKDKCLEAEGEKERERETEEGEGEGTQRRTTAVDV